MTLKETVESRAVKIAAEIMTDACLCRYDDPAKCFRVYVDEEVCNECIERWLLSKARREIGKELRKGEAGC